MNTHADHLPRKAFGLIQESLTDTRIVVLNGARQVGKSTLAQGVAKQSENSLIRYLDNPLTQIAARTDPLDFVQHKGLLVLDEVQRVPEIWLAMKEQVDRDPRPGRYLLTGSARLLGLTKIPDQLPGRSETIELWPLSQGEIDSQPDGFIDAAFDDPVGLLKAPQSSSPPLTRSDYFARISRGGYPEAVRRPNPQRRQKFFRNYIADIMSRDVHQVADIQRLQEFRQLLNILAGQTSGLLNSSRISREIGISVTTVDRYISILSTIYLIQIIPAYSAGITQRTIGTPKLSFVDCGLAAHLTLGMTTDSHAGGLLENFVLGELGRQLTWSQTMAQLFHYRDRDSYEVDAVLENSAGQVIGIEVKSSTTVSSDDFRGLRALQRRLGGKFKFGFVLYTGTESHSFGDRLGCLPISTLWTASPN